MRTLRLTLIGFGLGFLGSVGLFLGVHFLWSAVRHGGWF